MAVNASGPVVGGASERTGSPLSVRPFRSPATSRRCLFRPLFFRCLGNLARRLNVLLPTTRTNTGGNKPEDAMISLKKRYQKLKRAATRMMMAGDVQRYLHALRLMNTLRSRMAAVA